MDTTLRDGEQTSGVSFVPHEKLMIARLLLEELKVDRVEVASARVSEGEFDAVKMICDWAARRNLLPRVEVLGFVDGRTSVDWIHATGCRVIESAVQRLVEALRLPAEEISRRAYRRHPCCGGLCQRTRHGGQRLSGRLEQRHERFSRIRFRDDGCTDANEHTALYAARYVGHPESSASYRIHAEDGETLSESAFRLPCPQ